MIFKNLHLILILNCQICEKQNNFIKQNFLLFADSVFHISNTIFNFFLLLSKNYIYKLDDF